MAPRVDPVHTTTELPAETEVVVIGGGIVGTSTALFLAERGVPVVLCEKGRIAGEQSSRNWGWCRKMGRDLAEVPLAVESLRLWEGMNARTNAETGFRQTGIVYLCDTEKEAANYEAWLAKAESYQLDSRLIGPEEIDRLLPGSSRRWPAALYTPSDGCAEPEKAASAIANAAFRAGAVIIEHCAVRGIETTGGAVSGVVTERGSIRSPKVVLAGGAWSRLFCGNLGVELPQLKLLASVMRSGPVEGAPGRAAGADDFAFRKRLDGGYTIARRNANVAEITPESFRLLFDFLPAVVSQWHELRLRVGPDRRLQHQHPASQGLAVRYPADAEHLRRQARGSGRDRERSFQRRQKRRGENSDQPEISAQGRGEAASGSRSARDHRIVDPDPVRWAA